MKVMKISTELTRRAQIKRSPECMPPFVSTNQVNSNPIDRFISFEKYNTICQKVKKKSEKSVIYIYIVCSVSRIS